MAAFRELIHRPWGPCHIIHEWQLSADLLGFDRFFIWSKIIIPGIWFVAKRSSGGRLQWFSGRRIMANWGSKSSWIGKRHLRSVASSWLIIIEWVNCFLLTWFQSGNGRIDYIQLCGCCLFYCHLFTVDWCEVAADSAVFDERIESLSMRQGLDVRWWFSQHRPPMSPVLEFE
jgi:hypothetical protein